MSVKIWKPKYEILVGDSRDVLKTLPDNHFHCCVTSPPYFNLRNYQGEEKQVGRESTPEEFVDSIVEIFREVKRVLRDDGVAWINIGDTYSPDKSLYGIPWRMAFALQADGWYLRQDIIWAKPNPTPESIKDRCTKAHEYIFMLTKSPKYHFDWFAIREDGVLPAGTKAGRGSVERKSQEGVNALPPKYFHYTGKRQKRDVWNVTVNSGIGIKVHEIDGERIGHYATYPPDLIDPCVKASTSPRDEGCCSKCGMPARRIVKKPETEDGERTGAATETVRFEMDCDCYANRVPCRVLDPFSGAGTSGIVAMRNGCDYTGVELSPKYAKLSRIRLDEEMKNTKSTRLGGI
jgi:DNA modification methylase